MDTFNEIREKDVCVSESKGLRLRKIRKKGWEEKIIFVIEKFETGMLETVEKSIKLVFDSIEKFEDFLHDLDDIVEFIE